MFGLGSYSTLGIGLAVTLVDNFTNNANRVNQSMNGMANNAQSAQRRMAQNMQTTGAYMMGLSGAMAVPFVKAIDYASKFQYVMSGVKAATQATTSEFAALEKKAIDLGNSSIFSAKDVADAMYELSTAGYKAADVYKAINGIVALGATADVPLNQAALLAANIRNAFQIPAEQTDRIADLLSLASIKSSAKLPEMAEGMKYVSARASMLKVPLEETIALIATLNSMGLHGSTAGTAADNLLRTMATAMSEFRTKKQSSVMSMIGLAPKDMLDAQGNLIALDKLVEVVFSKIKKYTPQQQSAIVSALINERGARAQILAAISGKKGEGISFGELTQMLKYGAAGSAEKTAGIRQDNLYGDLERVKSTWESVLISIGKALSGPLRPALQLLNQILTAVTAIVSTKIGGWLMTMLAAYAAVNFAVGAYKFTMGGIALLSMQGVIANQAWATSAVTGYGAATVAARTYGVTMATINRFGMGSMFAGMAGVGWNAGAGRFVGAGGRFMGMAAVAGNLGLFGRMLLMATGALQVLITAITAVFTAISGAIAGIIAFLGPLGIAIAAIAVIAGGLYLANKGKNDWKNTPQGVYNHNVSDYKMKGGAYKTDSNYHYVPKTREEIKADLQEQAKNAYGQGIYQNTVNPLDGKPMKSNAAQTIIVNIDGKRTLEKQIEKDVDNILINTGASNHH